MTELFLTFNQALQLVGLGPSLFLVAFLMLTMKHFNRIVVPVLFFLGIACAFALPLITLLDTQDHARVLRATLLLGESLIPAVSFLLIVQFATGKIPSPWYWLILSVPMLGGSTLIYVSFLTTEDLCIAAGQCASAAELKTLYGVFSSGMIFLLLTSLFISKTINIQPTGGPQTHRYWLIITLIALSLLMSAMDLAELSGHMSPEKHQLVASIVRIAYIYLVMTSIFRVFDPQFEIDAARVPTVAEYVPSDQDEKLAQKIRSLLEDQKLYREMGFSREKLAKAAATSEHQLSKVINRSFGKNFNRLINFYRVEEAKERLSKEAVSITVIAFEVGFNSIASFNRVFKEETNLSPTEYREHMHRLSS